MATTPFGLVGVGLHAQHVLRDASTSGAHRPQRDCLPVARQPAVHQAPQARDEVILRNNVVLKDKGQWLGVSRVNCPALCPEVPCSAAHCAGNAAHAVAVIVGSLLRQREVEAGRDYAGVIRGVQVVALPEVEARDPRGFDAELAKTLRDLVPAASLRVQVQHVDCHLVLKPVPGICPLRFAPCRSGTQFAPVAHMRVLQRVWPLLRQKGHHLLRALVRLGPRQVLAQLVQAPVVPHSHPAPVPARVAPASHLRQVLEHLVAELPGVLRDRPCPRSISTRNWKRPVADAMVPVLAKQRRLQLQLQF
mmetsp:Transcript_59311/g.152715  ORF Transcript_59311/g.152715 Transcript_59311/m.152715 type:complete len:306 (+) Transcript_59311:307-1224(+)